MNDIHIIRFSSVINGVLLEFFYCLQDFEKFSDTIRLVVYLHIVKTKTALLNLQMELVELKYNEEFVKKFKDEKKLSDTWRGAVKYPNLQELA